ncbi:hypothetical protein CON15_19100 [Bacillus cereus]|uniref:Uncharacterized protein n=2 Tax=Bacillus thuringiensis TaxID=1428 RepID=A0AB36VFY7_BACTU|nr:MULTISPECIES: hypothetical protein [Bacillus cereus group]PDZ55649.1 hypothetical protein CON15_19100 [Bacillus cereus]PFC28428.1 hypothetical protein CN299_19340 [Bacillus thuringiensis]PFO26275.1 hypothetical protein COJ78_29675 [Bacillus thuringiensis]PFS40269.1 hypothetical protein COK48_00055 [Bacillus thuringiensis]PFS58274.1 hypothetical protein COK64_18000 [Bacillus thuringiensis]
MNTMGRETTYPAKKQELFYFDDKKDVYRPLTENGAIPVVIKGGNVGGGNGTASTGEVIIKNDKLVVQLADKLLETKVTNDSLNVQVLNPIKTVESKVTNTSLDVKVLNPTETVKANITNKSMDVNVLNPVTETTIKNKTLDVTVAPSKRKVVSLFGGKLELPSEDPMNGTGHATDFIDVDVYNQLALTSMISGKNVSGEELQPADIQQFNTRLDAYLEWSHDGVNIHGITYPMGMSPDDTCIKANGKYIDILSKYVRVRVKGSHGGDWKPILDLRMVLK